MRRALGASLLVVGSLALSGSSTVTRAQVPAPTPPAGAARPGAAATQTGQPPASDTAKPPTGIIRGHVVSADGRAIRGAQVNLTSAQEVIPGGVTVAARENRAVATDAEGRYEIKELPAGRYRVSAIKTGYVRVDYGQRVWTEPGTQIELVDGQTVDRIDFSLPRGGVIVVTATNPRGEPMAGVQVQAMQFRFTNGRRSLQPAVFATTNDLGQGRAHGLPPGEYYISVSPPFANVGAATAKTAYVPTYFPGTLSAADAERVSVRVSQETNVTVPLIAAKMVTVSGHVTRSDGSPIVSTPSIGGPTTDPSLGLMLRQEMPGGGFIQRTLSTKPDGSFTLPNLLPGNYAFQVRPIGNPALLRGSLEFANVPVTVAGEDISNLTIVSKPGAKLSGKMTFDTGAPPADKTPQDLRLFVYSNMVDPPLSAGVATMNPDYSFEIVGVAMTGMVRFAVANTGWGVKSEMVDGKDIVEAPIAFEPGREYKDIQVFVTQKRADVVETALDADGRPARNSAVVLFPQDPDRWFPRSLSILAARSDQNGQFKISRVAGGKYGAYNIIALDSLEPGAEMDFELLARLAPKATRITLGEDEVKTVNLRMQEAR